jgi:adenylate cyclase
MLAGKLADFALLELDRVQVVGREAPETLYALLGDEGFATTPEFARLREHHNAMLAAYHARDWGAARNHLGDLAGLAGSFDLAQFHSLYGERIEALAANPPPDSWNGVYVARSK